VIYSTSSLTTGADSYGPTVATATARTTVGNDTFRGQLDTADFIDGGEGTDTINASIADGATAVTIKPLLSNVEVINLSITDGNAADNLVKLDLGDSTGVETVALTFGADVTTSLTGARAQDVTLKAGGATSVSTVAYSGLSSATDGGQDAKTINVAQIDLATLTVAAVEELTLNVSGTAGDIDTIAVAALEKLTITGGASSALASFALGTNGTSANDAIEFDGLDTGEIGVIDASQSTGNVVLEVDDSFDFTATGGAGKLTISNDSAGAAAASGTAEVTITAGAGGINATIEGGANTAAATAITSVTITGSAAKDTVNIAGVVNPTDITSTALVNEANATNATVTTGEGDDSITIDAGVVSIDAGAGDDTLTVTTFSAVTSADSINLGDGDDTVVTSEATLSISQRATMARFVGAEAVTTTATAEKVVNTTLLGTVSKVTIGAHTATAAVAGNDGGGAASTAGIDALAFTSDNTTATLVLAAALTGQAGSANTGVLAADVGGTGGTGLDADAYLDNGNNSITVALVDNADITGGVGGAAANDATNVTIGGAGGIGFDANEYETINLVLSATDTIKDTVTISGGAGGVGDSGTSADGGAAGSDLVVGTNATINITETLAAKSGSTPLTIKNHISSIDLGTIVGNNVNVQAGTINGSVTIAGVAGNSTIVTGAGADSIAAGTGIDTINTGAGDDVIDGQTGADMITTGTGNDIITLADADSTESAMKKVYDFTTMANGYVSSAATDTPAEVASTNVAGANADILDISNIAVVADKTASDTGVNIGAATDIKDVISNGILTLTGANASAVDTLGEWIDQAEAAIGNSESVAFVFGGDTYVIANDGAGNTDVVIQLVGTVASGLAQVDSGATALQGGAGYVLMG
jgi:Ca2+-binding RTX toxin-like protein